MAQAHAAAAAGTGNDSSDDEQPPAVNLSRRSSRRKTLSSVAERWVPYKQTNGVAVYYLDEPSSSPNGMGGEYMVSAAVRGSPGDVLDVLINGSSNTTILGPASKVELLDCGCDEQEDDNVKKSVSGPSPSGTPPPSSPPLCPESLMARRASLGYPPSFLSPPLCPGCLLLAAYAAPEALCTPSLLHQVMRLVLEAPGWAGRFCAPRQMLVERMLKTEEGMHVVLFSSVDEETVASTSSTTPCEPGIRVQVSAPLLGPSQGAALPGRPH